MTASPVSSIKCKSFILFDGAADETWCIWPEGHLGCHSTWVEGKKIKWPDESSLSNRYLEALKKYGRHQNGCSFFIESDYECSCGLDKSYSEGE